MTLITMSRKFSSQPNPEFGICLINLKLTGILFATQRGHQHNEHLQKQI
jgi:hypothetical protein